MECAELFEQPKFTNDTNPNGMSSYDHNGYMQYEAIRDYYDRLTNDSVENIVSHLWYNILREYFVNKERFQLEVQPRPGIGRSNDITVLFVNHGKTRTLILVENNRVSLEADSSSWAEAVEELTSHMRVARLAVPAGQPRQTMFGIVTIGHYSRFYVMEPGQVVLTDHPTTGGDVLEFRKDEPRIVSHLLSIKEQASSSSS